MRKKIEIEDNDKEEELFDDKKAIKWVDKNLNGENLKEKKEIQV